MRTNHVWHREESIVQDLGRSPKQTDGDMKTGTHVRARAHTHTHSHTTNDLECDAEHRNWVNWLEYELERAEG